MKLPLRCALTLLGLAGCPREKPPARGAGDARVVAPADASVDAAPRFRPAALQLASSALTPVTLDWDRPLLTPDELEDAVEDGADAVAAARARLGRFVVVVAGGRFDPYDAARGTLSYRTHGLEGIDVDPPVVFVDDPPITVGSLPGPMGGSVRLDVSELLATATTDAATAAAVQAAEAADPVRTQLLVELGEVGTAIDGVTVVRATLHGVRLVRAGAREVLLEGAPVAARPR